MCVIIAKPIGIDVPTDDVINACATANPHGFGIVTPTTFYKGLSLKQFKKHLRKVRKDEPCLMHFRYATHGSVCRANCHPFRRGDVWFMHNGILNITPKGDMTDSETAFQDVIYPEIEAFGYGSDEMYNAVESVRGGSRFAFLSGDRILLNGDFVERQDGCFYSNLNFVHYLRKVRRVTFEQDVYRRYSLIS